MKILDRYIIKKYLGTLGFMLILLSIIVVVIDVLSKSPRIESNGFTIPEFLVDFYPYWMINLVMTFMSILVFISVIYFTSRLANNTEIVAIISSGASFHRFAKPYFVTSFFIAFLVLGINHFILPWANIKKTKLEAYTYNEKKKDEIIGTREIATSISPTEYIFANSYNSQDKRGSIFTYQKYDKKRKLIQQVRGSEFYWDQTKKVFIISNYLERKATANDTETLTSGNQKEMNFGYTPEDLFPDELLGQTKTTPELLRLIKNEKQKGNKDLNLYLNDLHQRTSMPVSIVILTVLALSLSSQKKRGGLGINLAIGIALAFVFVFSFEALKIVSENKTLTPMLAMWLPNIVFAPLALILYFRRANQ